MKIPSKLLTLAVEHSNIRNVHNNNTSFIDLLPNVKFLSQSKVINHTLRKHILIIIFIRLFFLFILLSIVFVIIFNFYLFRNRLFRLFLFFILLSVYVLILILVFDFYLFRNSLFFLLIILSMLILIVLLRNSLFSLYFLFDYLLIWCNPFFFFLIFISILLF